MENGKIFRTLVKFLKKKFGQSTSKKYLYHDNLIFLLKVVQSDDTDSSIDDTYHDNNSLLNEDHDVGESENNLEVETRKMLVQYIMLNVTSPKNLGCKNAKKTLTDKF